MTRHQRSKSFSDSLLLADDGNGGVVVSGIRGDAMTNQGLKKGDEIVGATISFDDLKKDEILDILKLIEPYNDKIQVLTKQDLKPSKSMGNLDLETVKTPDEMLRNSYNTFFNAKVKKFLKDNPSSGAMPGNVSPHENPEELKPEKERDATSVDLNMDLPSLNGKPKVDVTDFLKAAKQRQKGNVPTTDVKGLDSSDTPKPIESTTETAENCLSAEVALPQVDIKAPDEMSGGTELPVVDVVAKSPDISEVDPSGLMPTAPDHNICVGVDMAEPNANVKTDTDISASPPVVLRGKDHVQSTLDVSLPVLHAESPETTVKLTDDMQVPSSTIEIDVLPSDTNPPEVEFTPPNTDIHIPSKNKTKSSKRKSKSRHLLWTLVEE
ncbi:uncharacterized protein LOC116219381 [Clupea harengus]|uniref:Uncharacterized protein LOC116219381 n=1 Tax=Clupea harengus TaxID=7950 RepID=A0A8M1KBF6_CLUHA|nr:uncharacterized protein LOC116219381 [Clupea harengus]